MFKVAALTQGMNVPSTRFRFLQHMHCLIESGLAVAHLPAIYTAYPPAGLIKRTMWLPKAVADSFSRVRAAENADLCFLQRELVSTLVTAELFIKGKFVLDIDDAIYLKQKGPGIDKVAKRADLIICGNRTLAEHYADFGDVVVLPTAVDVQRYEPIADVVDKPIVIGWSGSSSGFSYLRMIEPAIKILLDMHPRATLTVMADTRPTLSLIPAGRFNFVPWGASIEVSVLQSFTVGLMPLTDDAWSRGKCSYKMLLYMACGLPVVVSPVGMNSDVLKLSKLGFAAHCRDDWVQSIDTLLRDSDLRRSLGMAGRNVTEKYFSSRVIGPRLAGLLKGCIN